jgi:hypothetical protein
MLAKPFLARTLRSWILFRDAKLVLQQWICPPSGDGLESRSFVQGTPGGTGASRMRGIDWRWKIRLNVSRPGSEDARARGCRDRRSVREPCLLCLRHCRLERRAQLDSRKEPLLPSEHCVVVLCLLRHWFNDIPMLDDLAISHAEDVDNSPTAVTGLSKRVGMQVD